MEFKKLISHNFKAYKDMTIDFDTIEGISLIIGKNDDRVSGESSNGSAKSTILDALMYALFGKTATRLTGDSIISRFAKHNTSVVLTFTQQGILYTVKRYRKHAEYKNKVLFFKEEEDITQPTNKSTDKLILDTIGIDFDTMLSTMFFNNTSIETFINATDKQRKALIENLIDASIYKEAQAKVKDDINDQKLTLDSLNHDLDMLVQEKNSNNRLLEFYEQNKQERLNQISKLKQQKEALTTELSLTTTKDTTSIDNEINSLKNELQKIELKDTTTLQSELNKIKNDRNTIINSGNQVKNQLKELKTNYDTLKSSKQPICSYCGNFLDTEHRNKELQRLSTELDQGIQEYNKLKKAYADIPDTTQIEAQLETVKQYNQKINEKQKAINQQVFELQNQKSKLLEMNYKVSSLKDQLNQINNTLNELENTVDEPPVIDKSVDFKINQKQEEISKQENDLILLNDLTVIFSDKGVKSQVMATVLPTINDYLKDYLNILSDGSLYAQLSTKTTNKTGKQVEKININIYSETTGKSFEELSSGEKKRVAIAINLAFMQFLFQNYNFNVLFLDEIFDSLDGNGIDNVEKLLLHIASQNKQLKLFVISHDASLKNDDVFDNLIVVTKHNGVSSVNIRQI